MAYDRHHIARELLETARGTAYHGNALYVARDIPILTDDDRWVLQRCLEGNAVVIDRERLIDIALRIDCDG